MNTIVKETNTDFEVRSLDTICANQSEYQYPGWHNLKYLAAGILFGIVLTKSEVISWFRIQEMFRLQSFHMYGVIGSAIAVGAVSVWLIRKYKLKTVYGEAIHLPAKPFNKGLVIGGLCFGFGWALTGACPGPLYALIGAGSWVIIVPLLSALLGTFVYGWLRNKLPH
jgi:uncharacterized membrane protein YedE/YeeE